MWNVADDGTMIATFGRENVVYVTYILASYFLSFVLETGLLDLI